MSLPPMLHNMGGYAIVAVAALLLAGHYGFAEATRAQAISWRTAPHHRSQRLRTQLPPADGAELVKAFKFDQKLLVCNAYPSKGRMTVRKNTKVLLADEKHAVPFRECRSFSDRVQPGDVLNLALGEEAHGSFEVGSLPSADVVLLLVLEKRPDSTIVNFQSFAFPPNTGHGKDAQIAVIDAFTGNSSTPRLKMEDHIAGKEAQTVSKRIEQLAFDRVYAIEPGTYDVSILDHTGDTEMDTDVEQKSRQVVALANNQNYVILRTGDAQAFPASLMAFPDLAMRSATVHAQTASLTAYAVVFASFLLASVAL
jgi:hypothetical protein